MKPASTTSRGEKRSICVASARSKESRSANERCSTTAVAMPRAFAKSSPFACVWLLMTAETGSPASTSACMLLPRPEMRTTIIAAGSCRRADHRFGLHPAIEVLRADVAERERRLAQGAAVVVRLLGDLGGTVITDVRRERRHQHERALEELLDARRVRLDAARAMLFERSAA